MKKFQGVKLKKGINTKKILTTNYKSLSELMKFLEKNENVKTNKISSHTANFKFSGTHNFDEALEMLRSGNEEIKKGLKKGLKLEMDKLRKEINSQPQGYVADVEGLFFDVAKVIEGEPECWYREPWDKTKKPRLQIPIGGSYNHKFKKEEAVKNATKIIALVKALEDNGFEVEMTMIFMADYTTTDNETMFHSVMIKNYDESFNWNKISAMLHPSFFRRIIFRDKELMSPEKVEDGYGQSSTLSRYFENGENMLSLSDAYSIEKFKKATLYNLRGK